MCDLDIYMYCNIYTALQEHCVACYVCCYMALAHVMHCGALRHLDLRCGVAICIVILFYHIGIARVRTGHCAAAMNHFD